MVIREASPNDHERASVAFTTVAAENLCASDHESPSCAFPHSRGDERDEDDESVFLSLAAPSNPQEFLPVYLGK
jgi:hypothetical protein